MTPYAGSAAALGPPGGIAIRTERLRFAYPDGTPALGGVDLAIGPGEVVAIVGQNGSGKSTLVRHFNGLLRATGGEVHVRDEPVGERHVADLARLVAVAFQNPDRQIFSGRVEAEVAFGARNAGLTGHALEERVAAALALAGLEAVAHANPYDLGFSRRKLLSAVGVVAVGAPGVVLDEPTTGLDAGGVDRVSHLIEALRELRRTVVVVSHDMRFVAEAVDRVVVMRQGRVILDGPVGDAFAADSWEALGSTNLTPPLAARVGARLGLGATPTQASLVERLGPGPPS